MIRDLLPESHRVRFQSLAIPEQHLVRLDSISFSTAKIVLSYGIKARTIVGYCEIDEETKHSDIVLQPDADPTDLGHEVGHHVLAGQVSPEGLALVVNDWHKAMDTEPELLFNCGLSTYSLTDGEEFFADLYSVWAMGTPLYQKARVLVRELFPNTAAVLDNLFLEGECNGTT